jgi:hypothetical protein
MHKWLTAGSSALLGAALLVSSAFATITFNPTTGVGFVGKGDVQYTFGWNNQQLQSGAGSVQFRANSEVVTEVSWICTNSNNENIQERARTTTTSIQGLVDNIARERNQITGFNLTGYNTATPPIQSSETDGPPLNSCPGGPWSLTTPAGDPVEISNTTTLEVSKDSGVTYVPLLQAP